MHYGDAPVAAMLTPTRPPAEPVTTISLIAPTVPVNIKDAAGFPMTVDNDTAFA